MLFPYLVTWLSLHLPLFLALGRHPAACASGSYLLAILPLLVAQLVIL
jgi:hypothetical protein